MRRLSGCLTVILVFAALFLILLARGPGLGVIPVRLQASLPIQGILGQIGFPTTPQPGREPTREVLTPTPQPSTTPAPPTPTPTVEPGAPRLTVAIQGLGSEALEEVIDGNGVLLVASVPVLAGGPGDNPAQEPIEDTVRFALQPLTQEVAPIATCRLQAAPGSRGTCSAPVAADGWAWQDHRRVERRTVFAALVERSLTASASVAVRSKPVVLVHGFNSGAWAWHVWTGPDGFLAARGLQGFAVGDGQFGVEPMNTGDFTQPHKPTNTIAQNAAILARYVEAVRQATGADRVDLVGHSMGGLISRHYIATLMPTVERPGLPPVPAVNQLYMIGTPNAGSTCAIPAASLGLYPPATTEITPAYVQYIFNREINDPRGVPFFVLAGDPVRDYAALVCTPVPTDVFVSVASAEAAIPVTATELPVRHGEQTGSPQVFEAVFQSLSRGPDEYPIPLPTSPARPPEEMEGLQIASLQSGTLAPDGRVTVPVDVDQAEAVSFVLYAPGQDVDMTIISSRGRDIRPDTAPKLPDVTRQKDGGPGTTATEGFRIRRPETGTWQVVLTPKAGVQSEGAAWVVAVFVQSDLRLAAEARPTVVPWPVGQDGEAGQAVELRAVLTGPSDPASTTVRAVIRDATGRVVAEMPLFDDGAHEDDEAGDGVFGGWWTAEAAGLYTVTLTAAGQRTDGDAFQRVTVVAVRVD